MRPLIQKTARFSWWAAGLAASVVMVVSLGLAIMNRPPRMEAEAGEVLGSHLRSMQLEEKRLVDVVSTDQHTVKPWFEGKLDFAPPVWNMADRGYPLVGGRLDYLHGRPAAALVYQHGKHVINLFIWPGESGGGEADIQGYHLVKWSGQGMTFWAVSDVKPGDLEEFSVDFQRESGAGGAGKSF